MMPVPEQDRFRTLFDYELIKQADLATVAQSSDSSTHGASRTVQKAICLGQNHSKRRRREL